MANTLQFVDDIASSPTVRLDLNATSGTTSWYLDNDPDFSPPDLKRSVVSTLLRDGEEIPASAYENRVLGIDVTLKCADEDDIGTELQKLNRELDRARNILKWQSGNATNPVFFRTLRSPQYRLHVDPVTSLYHIGLRILAEPFAYGLQATPTYSGNVDNDPAGGTNPCLIDVTGVLGDVPSPAFITIAPTTTISTEVTTIIGVRQRGTPSDITSWFGQAEAMTQGTDTSVQTTDSAMSGATNNYSQTSFATATLQTRLTTSSFPVSGSSVACRGVYRVFARLRRSDATSDMAVQATTVNQSASLTTVPKTTNIQWLDMGLLSLPDGVDDPVYTGYSLTEKTVSSATVTFKAERTSGTGTLDWDVFLWVPADEAFMGITHIPSSTLVETIVDGPLDKVYRKLTTGSEPITGGTVGRVGGVVELVPNQTNRVLFLLNAGTTTADDLTWATTVDFSYWPRWLYIRP